MAGWRLDGLASLGIYGVTRTLIAMLAPFSWRYVTSALAPTLRLPSIVVFLSSWKTMVLGLAESCSTFWLGLEVCDCPTVRVNEFFSTEAIFPDTDCSCEALGLLDKLTIAVPCVAAGGRANTAAMRDRSAKMEKNTRPIFLIFQPSWYFRPSPNSCAEDLPRLLDSVENLIFSTEY